MDSAKRIELINKVNADLLAQFGAKHVPITAACVEKTYKRNVLGFSVDAKTKKGLSQGYLTGILYLAPASLSGINICPKASAGCRAACLYTAGRGRFYGVTRGRIVKTLAYHFDQKRFFATIKKSINSLITKAKKNNYIACVRLNGTSDIPFELNSDIIQSFPEVIFYDYTALPSRYRFKLPDNYSLTFSLKENNDADALQVLSQGGNVAAVFRTDKFPMQFLGHPVISGDKNDLRFLDNGGTVIALKAKGKAKKDTSGFVKDAA